MGSISVLFRIMFWIALDRTSTFFVLKAGMNLYE